jgi:hypothetical protein
LAYNQPFVFHGMHRRHNGDLEEFRGQNYEETKDEIQKGMDMFSEAGATLVSLYKRKVMGPNQTQSKN